MVKIEAFMAVVRVIPSKKKVMFKVIIKMPTNINLGKSARSILNWRLWAKKNGVKRIQAKAKRNRAKLIGGNSCSVILATTKFAPQIRWAKIKATYGRGLDRICEDITLRI